MFIIANAPLGSRLDYWDWDADKETIILEWNALREARILVFVREKFGKEEPP